MSSPDSMQSKKEWLLEYRHTQTAALGKHRRIESLWTGARVSTFVFSITMWYPLRAAWLLAAAAVLVGLAGFAVSVLQHTRARDRRQLCEYLIAAIDDSLKRLGGAVVCLRRSQRPACDEPETTSMLRTGHTWQLSDQEIDDLDLYASPIGLFGMLNRTDTSLGSKRLSGWLEQPLLDFEIIERRQQMIRWLEQESQVRLGLLAGTRGLRGCDNALGQLLQSINNAQALPNPTHSLLLRLWSIPSTVLGMTCFLMALLGYYEWASGLMVLYLINHVMYLPYVDTVKHIKNTWRVLRRPASQYLIAMRHSAGHLPEDTELGVLKKHAQAVTAPEVLPKLNWQLPWADVGGTMHFVLNRLCFYDLHIAELIVGVVTAHRQVLTDGLGALADIEALGSLACFGYEQPVRAYAKTGASIVRIERGNHPLISPESNVANDVRFNEHMRMWIVTGSNMAGKSTFLRMVGVNTLLAQIGSAACCRSLTLTPVRLMTDLRIRDDISKEESYFLAEVRQLKRLTVPESDSAPVFGLIDEPLRGTNSTERVAASVALVQYLRDSNHFFIVATHEHRITELANNDKAENYHFRETIDQHGEIFDYQLRNGPAQIRNALRIIEREGFPKVMVDHAKSLAEDAPP